MRVEHPRLEHPRRRRGRDGALALAALLVHGALLALIPAFSAALPQPRQILIDLAPTAEQPVPPLPETDQTPEVPPLHESGPAHKAVVPGGGVQEPSSSRVNQPLNRPTVGNPAAGRKRERVRPAAHSPQQDIGHGISPSAPKGNVKQTPRGDSAPPKNLNPDATDVGRGAPITSSADSSDKALADELKPAPSKSAGVGLKPGAQQQAQTNAAPGKARPGNGNGTGDSTGAGVDSKPSPNKGAATGPPGKAQPQDGGQGGASARPGKPGGNGPGGGSGKGEGPGGPGTGGDSADVKPAAPENHDAELMADWVAQCKQKVRQLARTPEVAREKNHTGKVPFSFTVSKRGRLLSVSVNGGPGFSELEEECREATRVAGNSFKPFPPGVQAQQWTVTMSLSFPIL